MNKSIFVIKLVLLFGLLLHVLSQNYKRISLNSGAIIIGKRNMVNLGTSNIAVNEFLGIPYAEPPKQKLRFAKPQEKVLRGEIYATQRKPTCWQYLPGGFETNNKGALMWINNTVMDEDCLYLNVWSPSTKDPGKKFAVMVWIYGGGFTSGSSYLDVYDGSILAAKEQVVVVSMQYRVGAFGFLYLQGDDTSDRGSGNQGLWDQKLALEWVKKNIESFQGNPNSITIFGESAGAASVSMLWMSPLTQDLFNRAILESASLYARWALSDKAEAGVRGRKFAEALGCTQSNNREEILNCLQLKDPQELVDRLENITNFISDERFKTLHQCLNEEGKLDDPSQLPGLSTGTHLYFDTPLKPIIGDDLIPNDPDTIFTQNHLKANPELLIGTNKNEGVYFILYGLGLKNTVFLNQSGYVDLPDTMEKAAKHQKPEGEKEAADFYWISSTQFLSMEMMSPEIAQKPPKHYEILSTDEITNATVLIERLDKLTGDLDFTCPTLKFADMVAKRSGAKVYWYSFQKRTKGFTMPRWLGIMHGYEIEYVFGMPRSSKFRRKFYSFTDNEKNISDGMMRMWANFARTGNPNTNPNGTSIDPEWPTFGGRDSSNHLVIGDKFKTSNALEQSGCQMWLDEIPRLPNTCSRALPDSDDYWLKDYLKR